MLIGQEALSDGDHKAEIKWISNPQCRQFCFPVAQWDNGEEHVLDKSGPSSVHLLDKFPYSIIDDEVILLFFDIASEVVLAVDQPAIVNTA